MLIEVHATLTHPRRCFGWRAREPGYNSRVAYSDARYFNPSEQDTRIATARREAPPPIVEQILHILATMPAGTEIERRDRGVMTTFRSYAMVGAQRQAEIMRSVGASTQDRSAAATEIADAVARKLVGLPLSNIANR